LRGLTVAHTVVLFGMPPTESIPAELQFADAFRSAGSRLLPPLWLDGSVIERLFRTVAADAIMGNSAAAKAAKKAHFICRTDHAISGGAA
jgi:hypothetical protein